SKSPRLTDILLDRSIRSAPPPPNPNQCRPSHQAPLTRTASEVQNPVLRPAPFLPRKLRPFEVHDREHGVVGPFLLLLLEPVSEGLAIAAGAVAADELVGQGAVQPFSFQWFRRIVRIADQSSRSTKKKSSGL